VADEVAGTARKLVMEGKDTDLHTGMVEADPRQQMYWLYHQGGSLPNLKQAPRELARQARQDITLCTGIYQVLNIQSGKGWSPGSFKNTINADHATRTIIARIDGGTVYTNKLEARHRRDPNWRFTTCTACQGVDGGTHTFSGCGHPKMKSQYIKRHNTGVREGAKMIKLSNHPHIGKAVFIMDAGVPEDSRGFMGTRIPQWMMPTDTTGWTHRPDILLLIPEDDDPISIDQEAIASYQQDGNWLYHFLRIKSDYRLVIVEVGYTSDHNLQLKDVEKQAQHRLLADKLYANGWRSPGPLDLQTTITTVSIPIGICGRFLTETETHLQQTLKLSPHTARKMLQKMGKVSVRALTGIYKSKRYLDAEIKALQAGS
jgi:hypothetical protein